MKKKIAFLIIFILFTGIIFYTGYSDSEAVKQSRYFVTNYLDNFRGYLYMISLLVGLLILIIQVPFYNADIAIRIKNLKLFLLKYYIIRIIVITLLIQCIYEFVCFFFNYENPIDIFNIKVFINLFVAILSFVIFYLVNYFQFKEPAKAVGIVIGFNIVLLICGLSFFTNIGIKLLTIFNIYEYVIILFGSIYILLKSEKLEILKNE